MPVGVTGIGLQVPRWLEDWFDDGFIFTNEIFLGGSDAITRSQLKDTTATVPRYASVGMRNILQLKDITIDIALIGG